MPRELYNEGRVVGYSAYEMYLRHHLGIDPDHSPASEKEWLASMMAMGSSMLLRIGTDTTEGSHYIEVEFPKDSRLCAANNILASFFSGEGYVDSDPNGESTGWATKVTDYGPLIANSSASKCPSEDGTSVPVSVENGELDNTIVLQIREYMKITDGIVIQPGTWTININKPPYKDLETPTLSEVPKLRISLSDRVEKPFYILLTGFTNRTVVDGQTGFSTAVNTQSPADGDFLGPWAFPWAAKIFFHVPSSFVNYFMNNKYTRELPDGTSTVTVKSDAIIDLKQNHNDQCVSDYYESEDSDSRLQAKITELHSLGDNSAILATYMHSEEHIKGSPTYLPPALYACLTNSEGIKSFEPVDTVAPGSLHLYGGDVSSLTSDSPMQKSKTLESQAKHTTAFMRDETDSTYVVYELNQDKDVVPVSDDVTVNINGLRTSCTDFIYFFTHTDTGTINSDILSSVKGLICEEISTGYVSRDIIDTYGLTKSEYENLRSKTNKFLRFYGQYWACVEGHEDNYVAFFTYGGENLTHAVASDIEDVRPQVSYILVDVTTGKVAYMGSTGILDWGLGTLDFTGGTVTDDSYDTSRTDYLGTWWNSSGDVKTTDTQKIVIPASRHKHINSAASRYADCFYQNTAHVPYFPSSYSDFREWFNHIMFSDFLETFGTSEEELNVHEDFRNLTLQQMLKATLFKDVTKANTQSNTSIHIGSGDMYFYSKSTLFTVISGETPNFSNCHATMKAHIPAPTKTLYDIRMWSIYTRSDNNADWEPSTQRVNDASKPRYASLSQSGNNKTVSVSLVDSDNLLLNTTGLADVISSDMINWDILLESLNCNKSVDLLAGVKFRRMNDSNTNYLIMSDGTRLYISTSEPQSAKNADGSDIDPIPDGSIGIGW